MDSWKRALPVLAGLTIVTTSMAATTVPAFADDDGPGDDDNHCTPSAAALSQVRTANTSYKAALAAQKKAAKANTAAYKAYLHAKATKTTKDNAPAWANYKAKQKVLAAANKRVVQTGHTFAVLKATAGACVSGIAAPAGVTATAGNATVALKWTAVSGATGYQVFRGTTLAGSVTTTSFTDKGLTNGTQYTYTLKAVVGTATSAASAPVLVTPTPPAPPHVNGQPLTAPTGLAAVSTTSLDTGAVELTWNAVSGATGYTIYKDGVQLGTSTSPNYKPAAPTNAYHLYTVKATDGVAAETSPASAALKVGKYTGKAVADASGRQVYGNVAVSLVISGANKTVTGCWATYPTASNSGAINAAAVPQLCSEVLSGQPTAANTSAVASISGASSVSTAFVGSLQNALSLAGR
jgi:uncharacterized protein with FMN-binding domain